MHINILLLGLNTSFFFAELEQQQLHMSRDITFSVSATGCQSVSVWIQPLQRPEEMMPTPQKTSDDVNPQTTYKTTKFCYKFDRNI